MSFLPNLVVATIALYVALTLPQPASAHHGWSEYAQDSVMRVSGEIIGSTYEQPHGTLRVRIDGRVWTAVLAPPGRMENRGLTPEMIRPGAVVGLEAYPHRRQADEMRVERITASGKTIELR
jgi:hypothetical protein